MGRRTRSLVLLAVIVVVPTVPGPAAAQSRSQIDDPTGALGDQRRSVRRAATEAGVTFVSVVRSLGGRSIDAVIAKRFSKLAPRGSGFEHGLVLALEEREAAFGIRDPALLRGALESMREDLEAASRAATEALRSGDAADAAKAGLAALVAPEEPASGSEEVGWKGWLTWLIPLLLILAALALRDGLRRRRRLRAYAGGVSAIRDLREGTVVVFGQVEPAQEPLIAPYSNEPCVYYEYTIEDEVEDTQVHRYRDPQLQGTLVPDASHPSGWSRSDGMMETRSTKFKNEVSTDSASIPFYVRDATGAVRVEPERASFTPTTSFTEKGKPGGPRLQAEGKVILDRKVREAIIPAEGTVTVTGPVVAGDGQPTIRWPHWRRPSPGRPFEVSVLDPAQSEGTERGQMRFGFIAAAACLVGAIVVLAIVAS